MSIFGSPDVERLKVKKNIKGLKKALMYKKESNIRVEAAQALADFPSKDVVDVLITSYENDNKDVQGASEKSIKEIITKLKNMHEIDTLIDLLNYIEYDLICLEVAKALGNFNEEKTRWALVKLISAEDKYEIIKAALESLKKIGDETIIKELIHQLLIYISKEKKEKYEGLSALTMDIIEEHCNDSDIVYMSKAMLRRLIALYESETQERELLVTSLKRCLGKEVPVWLLEKFMTTFDSKVKERVGIAVAAFKEMAVEPLVEIMKKHPNPNICQNAAFALGETRVKRAVEPLMNALMNSKGRNRYVLAEALCKIGDKSAVQCVLDHIFGDPLKMGIYNIEERPRALEPLFGDYAELLDCIISDEPSGKMYMNANLNHLCMIKTQVSTNILHKICSVPNTSRLVSVGNYAGDMVEKQITYNSLRKIAKEELSKRGNPPYKPDAYIDKNEW